jgi:polyisoprenoid-binding protein YceI
VEKAMSNGRMIWMSAAAIAVLFKASAPANAGEFVLDPARTKVEFEMRALGGAQRGEFTGVSGTVALDPRTESAQIDIHIDAGSVAASNGAVERVVRSRSMLDVEEHKDIAYRADRVTFEDGAPKQIVGELTLRGVTLPIVLAVSRYECAPPDDEPERCSMIAAASFKRSAFGMTAFRALAQDEVRLAIRAEGVRSF